MGWSRAKGADQRGRGAPAKPRARTGPDSPRESPGPRDDSSCRQPPRRPQGRTRRPAGHARTQSRFFKAQNLDSRPGTDAGAAETCGAVAWAWVGPAPTRPGAKLDQAPRPECPASARAWAPFRSPVDAPAGCCWTSTAHCCRRPTQFPAAPFSHLPPSPCPGLARALSRSFGLPCCDGADA